MLLHMKNADKYQDIVLGALKDKIDDFYLAGGTALSKFYYNHRQSEDLDFFTRKFNFGRVDEIVRGLSAAVKVKVELKALQNPGKLAEMAVYTADFEEPLKIDFVEDKLRLISKPVVVNGINVLSKEDIYLRKIYASTGVNFLPDATGRPVGAGGRQEAKDYLDLYILSSTFVPLSQFAEKHLDAALKEGLIRWFKTYDRMEIKSGLLELKSNIPMDAQLMEKHFSAEIDGILEEEIGRI